LSKLLRKTKKWLSLALTAVLLLALLTPLNANANTTRSYEGKLVLGETPLAKITFSFFNTATNQWYDYKTDENGVFSYTLPDGTYKVEGIWVDPTWYPLKKTFTIQNGLVDGSQELIIDALDYQVPTDGDLNVTGAVKNGAQAFPYLTFSFHSLDGSQWYDAKTDKDGHFALTLSDGDYKVDGIWDGVNGKWYELNQTFSVNGGKLVGSTDLQIDVSGVVIDNVTGKMTKGTKDVSETVFSIRTSTGDKWYSTQTDANGNYSLTLPNGIYILEGIWDAAESKWYVLQKEFTVAGALQLNINVLTDGPDDLTPNVAGTLKKGTQSLPNVVFSVRTTSGEEKWYDLTSDETGSFSAKLPNGSYMLEGIWLPNENKWYELKKAFTVEGPYQLNIDVLAGQTTGDQTPPVIDLPSFGVTTTDTALALSVKVDENATGYYVVLAETEEVPHPEQVKAGKNSTDNPALKSGSFTLLANTRYTEIIEELNPSTKYILVTFFEDESGNATDLHVFSPTTSPGMTAPILSGVTMLPVNIGDNVRATSNKNGFLYLVPKGTPATISALNEAVTAGAGVKVAATANLQASLGTTGLTAGTYVVYAVDNYNVLSTPSHDISLTSNQPIVTDGITFSITSNLGTSPFTNQFASVELFPIKGNGSGIPIQVNAQTINTSSGLKVELSNIDKALAPNFIALINTNGYLLVGKFTAEEIGKGTVKNITIDSQYAPLQVSVAGINVESKDRIILNLTDENGKGIVDTQITHGTKIPYGTYNIQFNAVRDNITYGLFKDYFILSATNQTVTFTEADIVKMNFNLISENAANFSLRTVGPIYSLGTKYNTITHPTFNEGFTDLFLTKGNYSSFFLSYLFEKDQQLWDIALSQKGIDLQNDYTMVIDDQFEVKTDWKAHIVDKKVKMNEPFNMYFNTSIKNQNGQSISFINTVVKNQWGFYSRTGSVNGKITIKTNDKEYSKETNSFLFNSLSINGITGGEVISGQVEMVFEVPNSPIAIKPYSEIITIEQ
jgi:hypothetical protein